MTENEAIEQLKEYRQKRARLEVLSTYSVGAGITVSRLDQEDQLQELHRKLHGLPSYMYLSGYEQKLEHVAHAYLRRYPVGTKAQLQAVPKRVLDEEDEKLLRELRARIKKVIAARGWDVRDDIDAVIDRLAEFQDLRAEVTRVDGVLKALESYRPEWARLLGQHFIDDRPWEVVASEMHLSRDQFYRMRRKALSEYIKLAA